MRVEVHHGVVFAYSLNGGWFRAIKAFPEATTKSGEPDPDHPEVLKWIKEKS